MYKAIDIAECIIDKCTKDEKPIPNLYLQEIMFQLQTIYIKDIGKPLIQDTFIARQTGAMILSVYHKYCGFGGMPISLEYNKVFDINKEDRMIINSFIEEKRELPPWTLIQSSHKAGSAWDKVYHEGKGDFYPIPVDIIKKY